MRQISSVKRACICAVCIALCYVLPLAFHAVGLGTVFSPIHIPVLLCGMLCGWSYGAFCGVAGPVLSSVLSGMPPASMLVSMIPELLTYGLTCGLLLKYIRTRVSIVDFYLALLPAMLLGRIVGGVAKALFYLSGTEAYSLALWASGYFVETLPGTILQLLLIPGLVFALMKARLIPERYPRKAV